MKNFSTFLLFSLVLASLRASLVAAIDCSAVTDVENTGGSASPNCFTLSGALLTVKDPSSCNVACPLGTKTATQIVDFAVSCSASVLTGEPVCNVDVCDVLPSNTAADRSAIPTAAVSNANAATACAALSSRLNAILTGANCASQVSLTSPYYNFATLTTPTTASHVQCTASNTFTLETTVAKGCDATTGLSINGISNIGTTGTCFTKLHALKEGDVTNTCDIDLATGYFDFANSNAMSIPVTCATAPATYASAASTTPDVAFGCSGPPASISDVSNANVDITTGAAGYCHSLTTSTPIETGVTTSTCKFNLASHYYDFAAGHAKATSVNAYCSGTSSNQFTIVSGVTIRAGCDTKPTDGTFSPFTNSFHANSFDYNSGSCSSLTTAAPIQATVDTCTVALATGYYTFSGSTGINTPLTAQCIGANTFQYSGDGNTVQAGCGVFTASAVTGLSSTQISGVTTGCAAVTVSTAIKVNAACDIPLASNYRDFTTPSSPATITAATCSGTDAFTVTTPANVAEACTINPTASTFGALAAASLDFTLNGATPSDYCVQAGTTALRAGQNCKIALASRYYDFTISASPASYITATCVTGNTFSTSATAANIVQSCDTGSTITTSGSNENNVIVGTSANCGKIIKDQDFCVATCSAGTLVDPTLTPAGQKPKYQCQAASNTFTLQDTVSSPICVPPVLDCTAPPALNTIYDFTAGTNPCSLVTSANSIANSATCTLKCKGNTFPKNNVAPTFTCNPVTSLLEPTSFDICVPGSNLAVTVFIKGTVVPS